MLEESGNELEKKKTFSLLAAQQLFSVYLFIFIHGNEGKSEKVFWDKKNKGNRRVERKKVM